MTAPAFVCEHIAGQQIGPDTVVLHGRDLHPDTDLGALSRFCDSSWDLLPAIPDRHTTNQVIRWDTYPQALRHACKLYVFALLNVVEHAPRLPYAATEIPSIKTIWADLGYLKVFLTWLTDHGITRFADVTSNDLDRYHQHITDRAADSATWRRKAFIAVQRLQLYRDCLPDYCRLPGEPLWGNASAAELAGAANPQRMGNRTPRIHPDVMRPLLSAALLVIDTVASDVIPTAQKLITMRTLALGLASPEVLRPRPSWQARREHFDKVLAALTAAGHPLPGKRQHDHVRIDLHALALGGIVHRQVLQGEFAAAALHASGLPIQDNFLRVTRFSAVGQQPWREQPIEATDLLTLIRHITTACFLVITYLSGIRSGEALNLHRGCITRDRELGLIFLSGQQLKTPPGRRDRSPQTTPWVVNEQAALAVSVLEDLSPNAMLFPTGKFGLLDWLTSSRSRTIGSINEDIAAFLDWFNTDIAAVTGHPVVPPDRHGAITGRRLRRTLAWHIVRRPGGTIAGATQYGHLFTQITHGYAGHAGSGFLDEITFEEFLLRSEQLHDDHQRLSRGEHVSGPAADLYRQRINTSTQFEGLTITTPAQANTALTNPDLQVHHGALLTCVWRPETAACQDHNASSEHTGPSWPRCRLTCSNIAYTDRDIAELSRHADRLHTDLGAHGLPQPLRQRIADRLAEHHRVIANHHSSRSTSASPRKANTP